MGPVTGNMVVSRPSSSFERGAGAVALVHLYGPRGGDAGAVLIDRKDAQAAIDRLTAFLASDR